MKYDISKNKIKLHDSISLDVIGELKAIMDEEFSKKSKFPDLGVLGYKIVLGGFLAPQISNQTSFS